MTTIEKEIQELKESILKLEARMDIQNKILDDLLISKNASPTEIKQIAEINLYASKRQRAAETYKNFKNNKK